jgi:uncharacterized membrane protein
MKRHAVGLILILAFLGIADSAYLAQSEVSGAPLICNIYSAGGCNAVAESSYSKLFGIPLADYGFLFFTILFVLAAFELALYNQMLRRALQGFALVGVVASIYSVVTQVFIIEAICVYCLLSALLTFGVLVLASMIEPFRKAHMTDAVMQIS